MEFSVDLFEYQARDLFEKHGIPVLAAGIATTPEQAHDAAVKIGGKVVVKAQVKVGGRGKAGGVKVAADASEANLGHAPARHAQRRSLGTAAEFIATQSSPTTEGRRHQPASPQR